MMIKNCCEDLLFCDQNCDLFATELIPKFIKTIPSYGAETNLRGQISVSRMEPAKKRFPKNKSSTNKCPSSKRQVCDQNANLRKF